jgi:hypothetical protein
MYIFTSKPAMKKLIKIVLLALPISLTFGQADKTYLSNRYALERMGTVGANSNGVIPGLPPAAPEVIGDPFSKRNFAITRALLYNDQTINGVQAKYDILHDDFYIQTKQGLRVLPGHQVKSYTFTDSISKKESTYINGKEFRSGNGTAYSGFFEIVYDGEVALFKKTEASVQKANYHVALNVGRQDHQVNKRSEFYYLSNDKVEKLPNVKGLTTIFGDQKPMVDKFIKTNQLNLKDERHLAGVFEYYNSKISK